MLYGIGATKHDIVFSSGILPIPIKSRQKSPISIYRQKWKIASKSRVFSSKKERLRAFCLEHCFYCIYILLFIYLLWMKEKLKKELDEIREKTSDKEILKSLDNIERVLSD